jgi:hypothetical protein
MMPSQPLHFPVRVFDLQIAIGFWRFKVLKNDDPVMRAV